ncbi:bifunctional hydroxymethylpyrimidine kinase/phosphomethylpyrimidine kinase [Amphibacillus sp. MSJ-3]|uniref:bifunctional hydroxymethylpyrimidine kinase/phosphomethylpyrimidine kinase n=1 Tax=Amphibacillus sp. MSJ-3 TaxID=2841505 RepID=UPI001C0F3760|nr:bifunctional hydroxymethylpyrimidine kinase/phosphomethylpyrimidine kinase [Amphibacillus sp. MSJ-3]MBU5594721.1 bifunctional hydroxymethylpyrimidine kinase/phosphomethylpyrimidine kinase [Amphibacillus sp. MSJ-3]
MTKVKKALTIAGTDPTGGAGIQADLKTFQEREVYGMSVLTSVVAQNTMGVQAVQNMSTSFIEQQLKSVFSDIEPDAIKTGMIARIDMMELIASYIKRHHHIPYCLDPVMVATSGDVLMEEASQAVIKQILVPLATIVTPNLPEAEILVDQQIKSLSDMENAADYIVHKLGAKTVVVKGGHLEGKAIDVFYDGQQFHYLTSQRYDTKHTHGTGCTFSAVITAELAKGKSTLEAVKIGKAFISAAIRHSLELGKGNGPTNHWGYRLAGLPNQGGKRNEAGDL